MTARQAAPLPLRLTQPCGTATLIQASVCASGYADGHGANSSASAASVHRGFALLAKENKEIQP